MKYLESPALEELNNSLSCVDTGDTRVFGRIECYSCKNTTDDKRLQEYMKKKYPYDKDETTPEVLQLSPSPPHYDLVAHSPLGPISDPISRKTMFYLLATLNAAFPDYDFSDVKPESFSRILNVGLVMNNVNTTLFNMGNDPFAKFAGSCIWDAMNQVIPLGECDIYSFNPNPEIEPDSEEAGNVWSFYYFFFCRKLKRMVFFTCRAVSFMAPMQSAENPDLMEDDNLDFRRLDDSNARGLSYEEYTMQDVEL